MADEQRTPPQSSPKIIVTVDTEEEGLWGGAYKITGNTTHNLRGLERFQNCCQEYGVAPTYLIDAPVLDDKTATKQLKKWWHQGVCEVGSHCHPWCNPPFDKYFTEKQHSFLCNLPEDLQYQKLSWLTDQISIQFGRRPTSYRAGRYGFDQVSPEILDELGYLVDSSILPTFDYRSEGGPDFTHAAITPYRLSERLWEYPITAGFTNGDHKKKLHLFRKLRQKPYSTIRLAGLANRLNYCRRLKLSPEGNSLHHLKQLADHSINTGQQILVLMLHSSSLVTGLSPYAPTEEMLEHFYKRFTGILQHIICVRNATPSLLSTTQL